MSSSSFADLMTQLLRTYDLPLPTGTVSEAYLLHFPAQSPVYVVGRAREEQIHVLVEAGRLQQPPSAIQLLTLLEQTELRVPGHAVTLTVHRPTGTVVAWSCQRCSVLDVVHLRSMIDSVRGRAAEAGRRLSCAYPGGSRGIRLPRNVRIEC